MSIALPRGTFGASVTRIVRTFCPYRAHILSECHLASAERHTHSKLSKELRCREARLPTLPRALPQPLCLRSTPPTSRSHRATERGLDTCTRRSTRKRPVLHSNKMYFFEIFRVDENIVTAAPLPLPLVFYECRSRLQFRATKQHRQHNF